MTDAEKDEARKKIRQHRAKILEGIDMALRLVDKGYCTADEYSDAENAVDGREARLICNIVEELPEEETK